MIAIPTRLIRPSSVHSPRQERLYGEVIGRLLPPPTPEWVVGDLLFVLILPRPVLLKEDDGLPSYWNFLHRLIRHSNRWKFVVARLQQLSRNKRSEDLWEKVAGRVLDSTLTMLQQHRAASSHPYHSSMTDEENAESLASAYSHIMKEQEDFSSGLLDDLEMALIELTKRARSMEFMDQLQAKDLIKTCLEMPLDNHDYKPRLLRELLRKGDCSPRLPGDHHSLRGVSLKVRDDQIPKILPSELATNRWRGKKGQYLTADKVLNRQPTIYQNHDTQRPELDHKILITLLNSVAHHPSAGPEDLAELRAKAIGFCLLANAALKMPHDSIHADVAWFQRDNPNSTRLDWGAKFPLNSLKVTRSEAEQWRNVLEMDRLLPRLFVNIAGGLRARFISESTEIRDHPSDFLTKACYGKYDGIFIIGIAPEGEGSTVVPSPSIPLPELPSGTPATMLITVGSIEKRCLRGAAFPSLLAARMAPAILPLAPHGVNPNSFFAEQFLQMIIGPNERATQSLSFLN